MSVPYGMRYLPLIALFAFTCSALAAPRPNIIFIFIDDMAWNDLGCMGNEVVDTPHIDQLATDGLRFTQAYAAGAVCSPTRCAVQSGQNQARIGITAHIPGHWRPFERVITPRPTMALPQDTVTVAESLQQAGYRTGYVGKWHLGRSDIYGPATQGYETAWEINGPHFEGRYRIVGNQGPKPKPGQYRTDFEADLCIDFIQQDAEKPFFLMLSPFSVHIPLGAMASKVEKYRARAAEMKRELPHPVYAAMIEHVDDMVGRIVGAVNEAGLRDNTMIVFTSDNGGLYRRYDYREQADDNVTSLAPLRGEKGSLYEGGVRVPLIIQYPGHASAGSTCAEPVTSYDFYPTFVELADGELPASQTIDGLSLLPLLKDPNAQLARSALHWHYPHYHHHRPASSIREREWKFIEYLDGQTDHELYNLSQDPGETKNLAATLQGRAADLKKKLHAFRSDTLARMPLPNPSYDPARAHEWWSTRTGKPVDSDSRKRFPPTELD